MHRCCTVFDHVWMISISFFWLLLILPAPIVSSLLAAVAHLVTWHAPVSLITSFSSAILSGRHLCVFVRSTQRCVLSHPRRANHATTGARRVCPKASWTEWTWKWKQRSEQWLTCLSYAAHSSVVTRRTSRYDTIRDGRLRCAQKLTRWPA